jgi:hypothetical protein
VNDVIKAGKYIFGNLTTTSCNISNSKTVIKAVKKTDKTLSMEAIHAYFSCYGYVTKVK